MGVPEVGSLSQGRCHRITGWCRGGAVVGLASGDDSSGFIALTALDKAVIGAVAFGVVGAVIGYVIASSGKHDRLLVSVGPQRDGRFGLALSGRF